MEVLDGRVQDLSCTESPDLTTENEGTTPLDNSRADLPPLAFTPQTDRAAISPDAPHRTSIDRAVPGIQITGAIVDCESARFVMRLPATNFSGRLIRAIRP